MSMGARTACLGNATLVLIHASLGRARAAFGPIGEMTFSLSSHGRGRCCMQCGDRRRTRNNEEGWMNPHEM